MLKLSVKANLHPKTASATIFGTPPVVKLFLHRNSVLKTCLPKLAVWLVLPPMLHRNHTIAQW